MRSFPVILLLLMLCLHSCRDAFDFDYDEVLEPTVVIDGFITDNGRRHVVRVSMSTTINQRGQVETDLVNDAVVRIDDDLGNFTILNSIGRSGLYVSQPAYRAMEGRTYTLSVTLSGGEVYESVAKSLPPASPATARLSFNGGVRDVLSNNRIAQQEGAVITATINKDEGRHFYQWLIGHYFIRESALAPAGLRFCYVRDIDDPRVELLQDNPIGSGPAEYSYEIDFIPRGADMRFDFGVEGRLLTLTEEDFNFWDAVRRQAENSGGLFDAAPFAIEGNISNTRSGAQALGYFGVYRESIDRVFFTEVDLGFDVGQYFPCTIPFMAERPHPCEDCRLWEYQENLGPFRPQWWRN